MLSVLKIVLALLMFGIIIFVHELGHFLVAKACGVRVNEFAMGMGPKLLSFGKKETVYSLRLLPFGGFCAMEGEDDASDDPRAFGNKVVWKRMAIVVAGVMMNFLLGFIVLLIALGGFTMLVDGEPLYGTTTVVQINEDSSAYQSGLRVGDEVVRINGRPILTTNDIIMNMQSDEDGVMSMVVKREVGGKVEKVTLPEVVFEIETTEDGVRLLKYDLVWLGVPQTVLGTIEYAAKTECSLVTTVWWSLVDMLSGKYGLNELAGPVGTVDIIGDMVGQAVQTVSREDIYSLLIMFALISVNVGVINLLPLPALDGGRLLFLLVEAVIRRPVPKKFEAVVHFVGLVLLLGFMVVISFNDIYRLFTT